MKTQETRNRIKAYIKEWTKCGYSNDIPDEVPSELMSENLAPSYKQIVICLLKNDMGMTGLGFSQKQSEWYGVLKRIELGEDANIQERLKI